MSQAKSRREAIKQKRKEQQEQREFQREQQREQRMLQEAFNSQGELSRGWMRQLLNTDDLEDRLQPWTIKKIQSMLNKQWIVANLTEAETHDRTYWLEVQKYKILGEHPPEGSAITGEVRAFLFNDKTELLRPLTPTERNTIDQIITGLKNMVTRSRGGFEREQINTSIARTESEQDEKDQESSSLSGLFG